MPPGDPCFPTFGQAEWYCQSPQACFRSFVRFGVVIPAASVNPWTTMIPARSVSEGPSAWSGCPHQLGADGRMYVLARHPRTGQVWLGWCGFGSLAAKVGVAGPINQNG